MQKLLGMARRAIQDYDMIQDGDKIAVGVSGGKDSIALLAILNAYKKFSPQRFELHAINIDLGFQDIDKTQVQSLRDYCLANDIPLTIHPTDIANVIFNERKEKSPCSLCSKMRRGALNNIAINNGCNKLALGHHADDVLETMLMSLLYEGRFSSFAPISYMDKTDITLIRPFIYAEEKFIASLTRRHSLPVVFNPCPRDKHTTRQDMKNMIQKLDIDIKGSKLRMLSAICCPERNNLWDKYKKK